MLRAYLQGETISIGDAESRLEWLERFDYTPVPLEIVATGPRMLRAAAALADRITINVGAAPERISWALEQVDLGLEEAGRTRADVTIGTFVMAAVGNDRQAYHCTGCGCESRRWPTWRASRASISPPSPSSSAG